MKLLNLLSAALLPTLSLSAPTHASFTLDAANAPDAVDHLSDYFNLLARKVQRYKSLDEAPTCDIARAVLPITPDSLPTPEKGLTVKHVAIGRGTQNYTCNPLNATAPPVAAGAVATLYDASCLSASHADLLDALSRLSISYDPVPEPLSVFASSDAGDSTARPRIGPQAIGVSGVHYFNDLGQPFFDIDLAGAGHVTVKLDESFPAPYDAPVGLTGEKAVAWLKLVVREEDGSATKGLKEVYRVNTVGGSAPASCDGMPEKFSVQYVAQYWFTGSNENEE